MYNFLLEWNTKDELIKEAMIKWAIDFRHNIEYDAWMKLWNENLKFTACITLKENVMKMIYRWYLTSVKLAKMYRTSSKICWKCKEKDGDFYHMWWTCDKMKKNWELIYNKLKKIPEAFLLGLMEEDIKKADQRLCYGCCQYLDSPKMENTGITNWSGRRRCSNMRN